MRRPVSPSGQTRGRLLTPEEAAHWAALASTVTPLPRSEMESFRQRVKPVEGAVDVAVLPVPKTPPKFAKPPRIPVVPIAQPLPPPKPRALDAHGLEGGWDRRLAGGTVSPDFTLDLHGAGLDAAYSRLEHGLAAFDGYVGLNNHMGSRFTMDRAAMAPILAELHRRGLLFLDSVTIPSTVGSELAASINLPHTQRNVFLDNEVTAAAVHAGLMRLEQLARQTGAAVAIGHPHDVTLDAVAAWLPTLAAKGLVLAPISAVVRARGTTGLHTGASKG